MIDDERTLALSDVVSRSQEILSYEVEERTVLMSVGSGKYYGMDEVGTRIWALIEGPRTIAGLCAALEEEFNVAPGQCEADVLGYVQHLAAQGLVVVKA